jgi:hypothetical protein
VPNLINRCEFAIKQKETGLEPISICNSYLVAELASKWNQVKSELIATWEIVNEVRKEAPVGL